MKKGYLALEDGTIFKGASFGYEGESTGEIVFNTSMAGYQEALTDPSYKMQIAVMTYPLIGNYGVNDIDVESDAVYPAGLVVKEYSKVYSNHEATMSLGDYLIKNKIVAIEGIDTRKLTRHIRDKGSMRACISVIDSDPAAVIEKATQSESLHGKDLVRLVTCSAPYDFNAPEGKSARVAVIDLGIKRTILRILDAKGCYLRAFPATTSANDIRAFKPDGIFISNGPGDPSAVEGVLENVKDLMNDYPTFGICLGHQIIGLALGGKTYKMKFGHHGGNQPVKCYATGRTEITSQNHGYALDMNALSAIAEETHVNLNDNTNEGMRHKTLPIFSVQYHPEAAPGPRDSLYLFDEFMKSMGK